MVHFWFPISMNLNFKFHPSKSVIIEEMEDGEPERSTAISGRHIAHTNSTAILGSIISGDGRDLPALLARLTKAAAAMGRLSRVWRSTISLRAKIMIYFAVVRPVATYSIWTMAIPRQSKAMKAFDHLCLKKIFRIYWPDRISASELYRKVEQHLGTQKQEAGA